MTAFREMTHGDSWGKRQGDCADPASIASQRRFILFAVTWIDDDRASISSSFWHDSSCWQDGNDNLKLTTLSAIKWTFLVVAKFSYHRYNIVKHWLNCESNAQRILLRSILWLWIFILRRRNEEFCWITRCRVSFHSTQSKLLINDRNELVICMLNLLLIFLWYNMYTIFSITSLLIEIFFLISIIYWQTIIVYHIY